MNGQRDSNPFSIRKQEFFGPFAARSFRGEVGK